MYKILVLIGLTFLTSCSLGMYKQHDPGSFCKGRVPEIRLRPMTICGGDHMDPSKCEWFITANLHYHCKKWSSW